LRDTKAVKSAGFGQGAIPCDLIGAIHQVGCEPGYCRVSNAEFGEIGEEDLVVHGVERSGQVKENENDERDKALAARSDSFTMRRV
jgi:hypothetical protein